MGPWSHRPPNNYLICVKLTERKIDRQFGTFLPGRHITLIINSFTWSFIIGPAVYDTMGLWVNAWPLLYILLLLAGPSPPWQIEITQWMQPSSTKKLTGQHWISPQALMLKHTCWTCFMNYQLQGYSLDPSMTISLINRYYFKSCSFSCMSYAEERMGMVAVWVAQRKFLVLNK